MKIRRQITPYTLIREFLYGFESMPRINWVLSSGFHLSMAALLGITAVALAVRNGSRLSNFSLFPWPSEHEIRTKKSKISVPGLRNLGNNCFLNVILQALASCEFFQPFLQNLIEQGEQVLEFDEEGVNEKRLPLTVALANLLEDLCEVGQKRVVLSPQTVMLAMTYYTPNFNLTSQQDAAEAFLHLLSSLREESSDSYQSNQSSLGDVCTSNCRIIMVGKKDDESVLERWQKNFLGPFDGILGSILTCQSCSSQVSLSFESFHSLPISPLLDTDATNNVGSTLEDCLKQFMAAEQVNNYHCTHCWHNAGMKYLSAIGATEMEFEKLRRCSDRDSCECRRLVHLEKLPWSNKFSYTLKQLSIARSPKILCIHLKRASLNVFGEAVKLQGHITFPLILDLSLFVTTGVGIKDLGDNYIHKDKLNSQYKVSRGRNICCSKDPEQPECCLYSLVSVVEHFGRCGAGHYTVYRRSIPLDDPQDKENSSDESNTDTDDSAYWFSISDSEVHRVSEEQVLSAEATLLFYERINVQG